MTEDTQKRLQKAFSGLSARQMRVLDIVDGRIWAVHSTMSSRQGATYLVTYGIDQWTWNRQLHNLPDPKECPEWQCSCPDFEKRHQPCKHILAVKIMHAIPV